MGSATSLDIASPQLALDAPAAGQACTEAEAWTSVCVCGGASFLRRPRLWPIRCGVEVWGVAGPPSLSSQVMEALTLRVKGNPWMCSGGGGGRRRCEIITNTPPPCVYSGKTFGKLRGR